jgi:hypothetical protein
LLKSDFYAIKPLVPVLEIFLFYCIWIPGDKYLGPDKWGKTN